MSFLRITHCIVKEILFDTPRYSHLKMPFQEMQPPKRIVAVILSDARLRNASSVVHLPTSSHEQQRPFFMKHLAYRNFEDIVLGAFPDQTRKRFPNILSFLLKVHYDWTVGMSFLQTAMARWRQFMPQSSPRGCPRAYKSVR